MDGAIHVLPNVESFLSRSLDACLLPCSFSQRMSIDKCVHFTVSAFPISLIKKHNRKNPSFADSFYVGEANSCQLNSLKVFDWGVSCLSESTNTENLSIYRGRN